MSNVVEEINDLVRSVDVLHTMVEEMNNKVTESYNKQIESHKELLKLKYLFDLKKSTQVTKTLKDMTADEKKNYTTKQKMYLGKLVDGAIKTGKPETLAYYKIVVDGESYKINEE
jgi:uncharacterized coiled-coil DUF342 family protein